MSIYFAYILGYIYNSGYFSRSIFAIYTKTNTLNYKEKVQKISIKYKV